MDIVENIVHYFNQSSEKAGQSPEGLCPVCWGYQEYDHQIRKIFFDKQIDVNNHLAKRTIIREFVVQHLDGIQLLEGEIKRCPTCHQEIMHPAENSTKGTDEEKCKTIKKI